MGDSIVETEMEVHSSSHSSSVQISSSHSSSVQTSHSSSVQMESVSSISQEASQSQMTIETGPAVDENANAIEDANAIETSVVSTPAEISQDNIKTQLHEIINEIEQNVEPEEEEEVTKEQEDAVKSLVEQELKLMQEEEALLAHYQPEEDDGEYHHTWVPKGKYEKIKTEVKHEDINVVKVDDPKLTELEKPAVVVPQPIVVEEPHQNGVPVDMQPLINGFSDELEGLDIPMGIPLLARVLPKDAGEGERKISLERLFTPATDSPDLTPTRNKKIFASSDFYRPDHPTIEDQRDLAQRISNSLIVADNKMSRGQSMYVKRQERSEKWTGQEMGVEYTKTESRHSSQISSQMEVSETDYIQRKDSGPSMPVSVPVIEKPTLRPVSTPSMPSMPASVPVLERPTLRPVEQKQVEPIQQITSEFESPTGRGAALFAKRKKRMDKFIVDENTVQQSPDAASFAHQQTSMMSSSTVQSSNVTQLQNGQHMMNGGAGGDVIYTAECKVVTRSGPPTPQFEIPKTTPLYEMNLLTDDKREKRKSFNLAAKGFGTYNDFYQAVNLGTAF